MSPGKFEGEPEYVLHFWELALQGEADETFVHGFAFRILEDDRRNYPALEGHMRLYLWESNDGFVFHTLDDEPVF